MRARPHPLIVVSPDPSGSRQWVVSMATPQNFLWRMFKTQQEARQAARAMAVEGVQKSEDFTVWIDRLPHTLRASAIEATIDFVESMIADAVARKERDHG